MSQAPQLCEQCKRENRIATVNGPTCPHQPASGAAWFPAWWGEPGAEARRIAFLTTAKST
jgi:hypothetical protein